MRAISLFLFAFIWMGCKNGNNDEIEKVQHTILKLIDADNRSDLKAVLECYADSITLYPVGRESISGKDAIRNNYLELFSKSKLNIATSIIDVKIFDTDAYVKGVNTGSKLNRYDSSLAPLHDNYIALLTKDQSGEWKISKLLWGFRF